MRPWALTATVLLAFVALGHVLRIILGVQITAAGTAVPMWVSGVFFLVAGGVALMLWRETRR